MNTNTDETTARNVGYFTLALGFMILTLSFLSSCNTTKGVGRDVQHVGSHIESGADHVHRKIHN
ncbi:MAG: entericidin A/B family lipoprotein [Prosthecobacter sp.]|nr:entericidin A/B family lipoprotein [Prosthecobacter sp.]